MDTPIRTITNQTFVKGLSVANDIALVGSELNNANQGVFTYNLDGGELLQTLNGQGNTSPLSVAISPNGRLAVASTIDLRAALWDDGSGRLLNTARGPAAVSDNSSHIAFTPDGQLILSSYFGDLTVFDTTLAQKSQFRVHVAGGTLFAIASSAEGRFMAAGYVRFDNGTDLVVYDLLSGQAKLSLVTNKGAGVTSVAWVGNTILTGSGSGSILLFDAQSGAPISRPFPKHPKPVKALAASADGRLALSGSDDGTMKVIEITTGKELHSFDHADGQVEGVAFAGNGKAAVSCAGKTLKLWDLSGL